MWSRARTLAASSHPGPTIVVTAATTGLAVSIGASPMTVVVLALTILANQLSIGWSNDAIDAHRDEDAGRADKPAARGDIDARALLAAAIAAATVSIALSLTLGFGVAAAHGLLLAAGWAYNLGLKRTLAATACYAVGFGALPSMVTLAAIPPAVAAPWATAAGALLGIAAHFANVVPDVDHDRRHNMRALPHRLPARISVMIALGALSLTSALGAFGAEATGRLGFVSVAGLAVSVACIVVGGILLVRAPTSRLIFRVVMMSAIAAVITLLGAGSLAG